MFVCLQNYLFANLFAIKIICLQTCFLQTCLFANLFVCIILCFQTYLFANFFICKVVWFLNLLVCKLVCLKIGLFANLFVCKLVFLHTCSLANKDLQTRISKLVSLQRFESSVLTPYPFFEIE